MTRRRTTWARAASRAALLCLLLCACAATTALAQHGRLPVILPTPTPTPSPGEPTGPTMKKPEHVEVAPSHQRRAYDAARDTTYLNVDLPLVAHAEGKLKGGGLSFEGRDLVLTFQIAYRGKRTDDITAAYIVFESTTAPGEPAGLLAGATRLEVSAEPYEYAYDRTDYKAGTAEQGGAAGRDAPQLRREIAIFRIETEDLPHIADATRLLLKLGTQTYTVKSPQLAELRRTLATGDKK